MVPQLPLFVKFAAGLCVRNSAAALAGIVCGGPVRMALFAHARMISRSLAGVRKGVRHGRCFILTSGQLCSIVIGELCPVLAS
jgi:hypothetical protein